MAAPPGDLVRALLDGPSIVTAFEWHEQVGSTMARAAELAVEGHAQGLVVAADAQTAGRGRLGRMWVAPPGSSLLLSLLLRPPVPRARLPLLPLLAGVALTDAVRGHVPGVQVALKWPNDLLAGGAKAAGVLAEAGPGDAVVVGVGLNVDWRGVARPPELATATSLAEAAGGPVDRWRVLAGLLGVLGNRYRAWLDDPAAFLPAYRERCATIGRRVRVRLPDRRAPLEGAAVAIDDRGALLVRDDAGAVHQVHAGDVVHVRPA